MSEKNKETGEQDKSKMTPAQRAKAIDDEIFSLDAKEILNLPQNRVFKKNLGKFALEYKKRKFLTQEDLDKAIEKFDIDITLSVEDDSDILYFNDQIDSIQKAKDEFIKVLNKANSDWKFVSRWFEHFYEVWKGKFSRLSSDKKREGEAEFILSFMVEDLIRCDTINDHAKAVFKNLNDKYESVSRKITVLQDMYRLTGEIQRPLDSKSNSPKRKNKNIGKKIKKPSSIDDPDEVDWSEDF